MKKFIMCLLFIGCLFITGCGSNKVKEAATVLDFMDVLEEKNFTVTDNLESYEGLDYILESKIAEYEDIKIEMVRYIDSDNAEKSLKNHKKSFDLVKSTGALENVEKGKNYHSYSLVSNGRYMISSRIDNTLIFTKVMLEDKEVVEEILTELGY